jgi:hypothetical protein
MTYLARNTVNGAIHPLDNVSTVEVIKYAVVNGPEINHYHGLGVLATNTNKYFFC